VFGQHLHFSCAKFSAPLLHAVGVVIAYIGDVYVNVVVMVVVIALGLGLGFLLLGFLHLKNQKRSYELAVSSEYIIYHCHTRSVQCQIYAALFCFFAVLQHSLCCNKIRRLVESVGRVLNLGIQLCI